MVEKRVSSRKKEKERRSHATSKTVRVIVCRIKEEEKIGEQSPRDKAKEAFRRK